MTLSPPGWPRPFSVDPRHGRLPVPWISPPDNLGHTDPGRHAETLSVRLCQVCGQSTWNEEEVWLFVNESDPPTDTSDKIALAMDDAVLHPYCARLALGHCPVLKSLYVNRKLLIYKCRGRDVGVVYDHTPGADGRTPRHSVALDRAELVT